MNRALTACTSTIGLALALALGACVSPQVGAPCPIPDNATAAQRQAALQACYGGIGEMFYPAGQQKAVDILFMIDNSTSMTPKQAVLAKNIPKFIQAIDGFGADYHVGVVSSDIGSTTADGMFWSAPEIATCNSFKGDDGLLQVKPCTQRTNVSSDARNACANLCKNPTFANATQLTKDGSRFISKVNGVTNVASNIQPDPNNPGKTIDLGPIEAFQCMALVGDGGCGIEGQIESTKRALDGHLADNAGFRRSNAVLAVIYITDEDDCSVQLSRRGENSPNTRDCSSPDQNASFDCFNYDYRCLARSIQCDQPMNSAGAKTNCHERSDSYLEPLKKYNDFFTSLADPGKLLISGIWTMNSLEKGGQLVANYQGPGSSSPFLNRAGGTMASCSYTGSDAAGIGVFGQAQRRLSAFAGSFGTDGLEQSICDIDNYPGALAKIAMLIEQKLKAMCLPVVPKLLAPGQPNCLVGDVDENNTSAFPDVLLPVCSTTCCNAFATSASPTVADPGVQAACAAETRDCYCAVKSQAGACTSTAEEVGVVGGVWRKDGAPAPAGKYLSFRCAGGG